LEQDQKLGKALVHGTRRRIESWWRPRAVLIAREIKKGIFDYLKWFPEGNRAEQFKSKEETPKTIGEYYRAWVLRKTPPIVRPGLERDYRDHFRIYILPKLENAVIADLTPALLEAFRSYLLQEYEARTPTGRLSLKSVKNVIGGSFRAMIKGRAHVDYLIEKDPFETLLWPRKLPNKPDPFEEEERDGSLPTFGRKVFSITRSSTHYFSRACGRRKRLV
jgi:hypothetical protein